MCYTSGAAKSATHILFTFTIRCTDGAEVHKKVTSCEGFPSTLMLINYLLLWSPRFFWTLNNTAYFSPATTNLFS